MPVMRRFILWSTATAGIADLALSFWQSPWWLLMPVAPVGLWLWASLRVKCAWWGPVMCEFPTRKREALITFDLAPDPVETPLVLDLLAEVRATALFFVTGVQALNHPDLIKEIVQRGHGLGIHGMSYRPGDFWWWLPGRIRSEVETCLGVLEQTLPGYKVQWFRAPGGRRGPWLHPVLEKHGLQLMAWSATDGGSRLRSFEDIVIAMRRDINQGGIIALHHGRTDRGGQPVVPDLVRELVLWLRGQGYRFGDQD